MNPFMTNMPYIQLLAYMETLKRQRKTSFDARLRLKNMKRDLYIVMQARIDNAVRNREQIEHGMHVYVSFASNTFDGSMPKEARVERNEKGFRVVLKDGYSQEVSPESCRPYIPKEIQDELHG